MKKKQNTKTSRDRFQSEAITLYTAGLSVREIARQLNTSPATISRILSPLRTSNDASTNSSAVSPRRDASVASPNSSSASESTRRDAMLASQIIKDKINTAVADIIKQIQQCTFGETDIAKLATAADKLSTIAERIANIERLSQADNTQQGAFTADFTSRHRQQHKNN